MSARILILATSTLAAALCACAPGDAAGAWSGDLDLTGSTGSPPSTIGGAYSVSATVVTQESGTCGVTVDVANVGTWSQDDGVTCAGGGFDATLGADHNTALTLGDVEGVRLTATGGNQMTLVLSGSAPDWTCTFAGSGDHSS